MKYAISILCLSSLAQLAHAGGSMGTTGGGNLPEYMDTLPREVEVYLLEALRVYWTNEDGRSQMCGHYFVNTSGPNPGDAVSGHTAYASAYELAFRLDASALPRPEGRIITSFLRRRDGSNVLVHDRIPPGGCIRSVSRFEAAVDGRVVGIPELAARLRATRAWILERFDPRNIATYAAMAEFDQLFGPLQLVLSQLNQAPADVREFRAEARLLFDAIQPLLPVAWEGLFQVSSRITREVTATAQSVLSGGNGECDPSRYQELQARLRSDWHVGSSAFLSRLAATPIGFCDGVWRLPGMDDTCRIRDHRAESRLANLRSQLSRLLSDSILPACAGFAAESPGVILVEPPAGRERRRR